MRIYTAANDPLDFCRDCGPKSEDEARRLYGLVGEGPDGRGNCFAYRADHPRYDGNDYQCHDCRRDLTDEDDY